MSSGEGCYDGKMIDFIHDFFTINQVIILSTYGQIFFVLGLVLALQSWRHSRLTLARNLKWLAAFGLLHGLYEWGDVFIPLQTQYLAQPFVELLLGLQVVLLAVSFACLFQFGIETMRPLPKHLRFLRYLPAIILALWALITFGPILSHSKSAIYWYRVNNIFARYLLGFTGALVAAYGLRRQGQSLIAPLDMPHIWRTLQVAGFALAAYGVMAGLIVPPASFFPANWLNASTVESVTLIPVQIYRSLLGMVLIVAMLRALEVFRVELDRRLSSMEEAQMLTTERERIGRELHDGTLQTIYAAGLILKTTETTFLKQGYPPENIKGIQQTLSMLDEVVNDIRAYIGTLRNQTDSRNLATGLQELTMTSHLRSMVEVELTLDLHKQRSISSIRAGHLLAIANEGLSNIIRHAQATYVYIAAVSTDDTLQLEIKDNGQGFPADYVAGYGLRNMRDRTRMLGGKMVWKTAPGQGTTIIVKIPWSEEYENIAAAVS